MSAEDEFPLMTKTEFVIQPEEWRRMCFEIDRLRAEVQRADVIYPPASIETVSAWSAMQPLEAIRQTVNCPTCGGTMFDGCACFPPGMKGAHVTDCGTARRCGDCTDGKIDMARLLAVGAAVFKTYGVNDFGAEAWGHVKEFIETLRQVRP